MFGAEDHRNDSQLHRQGKFHSTYSPRIGCGEWAQQKIYRTACRILWHTDKIEIKEFTEVAVVLKALPCPTEPRRTPRPDLIFWTMLTPRNGSFSGLLQIVRPQDLRHSVGCWPPCKIIGFSYRTMLPPSGKLESWL